MRERIRFTMTMTVAEENQGKVLEVLRWVSGRTQDQPGNLEVIVGQQTIESGCRIRLDTEWSCQADLDRYLRCDLFSALLPLLDLSESEPAIWQEKLVERRCIDPVSEVCRSAATLPNSPRTPEDPQSEGEAGGGVLAGDQ
jgi:hypothetical protein